jgi:hypothetical protein
LTNAPRTQNEAWGFYGTMTQAGTDGDASWAEAMTAITTATGCTPNEVRAFLDSRYGRHFADDAASTTIDAATARWMAWSTTRRDQTNGIPSGLHYLTAYVTALGIEAELAA